MARDDGTLLALGAVALVGIGAAAAKAKHPRRGARNEDEVPKLQYVSYGGLRNAPLFTPEFVDVVHITVLADQVGGAYDGWIYLPTEMELRTLKYLEGRYCTPEYLVECIEEIPVMPKTLANARQTQTAIVMRDPARLKRALFDDDSDRVPAMSEDLSLQRLIWLGAPSESETSEFEIQDALEELGADPGLLFTDDFWSLREEIVDGYGQFWNMSSENKAKWLIENAEAPRLQG